MGQYTPFNIQDLEKKYTSSKGSSYGFNNILLIIVIVTASVLAVMLFVLVQKKTTQQQEAGSQIQKQILQEPTNTPFPTRQPLPTETAPSPKESSPTPSIISPTKTATPSVTVAP